MADLRNNTKNSDKTNLSLDRNGLLWFKNKIYIPNSVELKLMVLDKVHKKPYSSHPRYQKMVTTLRKIFYWLNMKGGTTKYLAKCQYCHHMKAEHQLPAGLLHPLPVLEWKWETISLESITSFPRTQKKKWFNYGINR